MRKRQSSKRSVKNANSPKKEKPPDTIFLSWKDILLTEISQLETIISNNPRDLRLIEKCTREIRYIKAEIHGINCHEEIISQMELKAERKKMKQDIADFEKSLFLYDKDSIMRIYISDFIKERKSFLRGLRNSTKVLISNTSDDFNFYETKKINQFAEMNLKGKGFIPVEAS